MATNYIKKFAASPGADILTQGEYESLPDILTGLPTGVLSRHKLNKVLLQSSAMAAAVAQAIVENGTDVSDDMSPSDIAALLKSAILAGAGSASGLATDLASTAVSKGADLVGLPAVPRLYAAKVQDAFEELGARERLNFLGFVSSAATRAQILAGTCTTPLDSAFAAFRAAIAADPMRRAGYLPAGVYPYTASVNWAIQGLRLIGDGARLRCTGAGQPCFVIDGVAGDAVGGAADGVKNVDIRGIVIEGATNTGDGVYSRANHYGRLSIQVRGCGASSAGYVILWNVGNRIELIADPNQGWYQSVPPAVGAVIDKFAVGADTGETSLCEIWVNIGGTPIGMDLAGTNMNSLKGFVQGCSNIGVVLGAGSHNDNFHGMTLESNTNLDFYINGTEDGPIIDGCQTMRIISVVNSKNVDVRGGQHYGISFDANSSYCKFSGIWDRFTNGGYIADSGTYNSFAGARKRTAPHIGRPIQYGAVTLTGNPTTITNNTGDSQYVTVIGGTGVALARGRRGLAGQAISYIPGEEHMLESGDELVISYTVAPTVSAWR